MASEERKALNARIAEENLFKTLGAGEQEAETDAFQCGRCKQVRLSLLSTLPLSRQQSEFPSGNVDTVKPRPAVLMSR